MKIKVSEIAATSDKPEADTEEKGQRMASQPPQPQAQEEGLVSPKPIPTKRLYFHDTYQFEGTATVLSVNPMDGENTAEEDAGGEEPQQQAQASQGEKKQEEPAGPKRYIVLLDQTLFHPQGGEL